MHQFITLNFILLPLRLLYDKDDKAMEMLTWMRKLSYLIAPTSKKSEFITVETNPTFLGIKRLHGLKAIWQVSHLSRVTENRFFFSFFLSHFTGKNPDPYSH